MRDKITVKFIKKHFTGSGLRVGDVVSVPKAVADGLVNDGFCELVKSKGKTK